MSNLIIENTGPRLVELPNVYPKTDKAGKVTAPGFHAQKLIPGENDVDAAYWDAVKGNPGVKILLACGDLKNRGEGKARSILADLDKLSPEVALRHIGNCENVTVLQEWKAATQNLSLRKTIEERVLELIHGQTGEAESGAPGDNVEPVTNVTID